MPAKRSVSTLEDHAGYWLRYVSNQVSHAFARKVEAQGVTVAEWAVLRVIFDAGAPGPGQLADALGMTRGAVSKLVERLRRKKLLTRSTSEGDRRRQTITLTAAGGKLVPALARIADENDHAFFGHLDPEEKGRLVRLLQNVVRLHGWKHVPVD